MFCFQIRLDDFRNFVYSASGIKSSAGSSSEDAVSQRKNEDSGRRSDGSDTDVTDAVQVRQSEYSSNPST